MIQVLLNEDSAVFPEYNEHDGVYTYGDEMTQSRWRLLVVEDAEEFVRPDAKDRVGQSLGRLLNLGDGMIGQGLRTMVLLTTNIPVTELHPAIIRPGRCMADIEVPELPSSEATAWLGESTGKATLAELFEMKNRSKILNIRENVMTGQYL
jgi:hypothetical protein